MASIRAAEKAAGLDAYKGASERKSHVGAVGLSWTDEVESALRDLAAESARNTLVLLVSHIRFRRSLLVVDEGRLAVDRPGEGDPRVERRLPSHPQRNWSLSPQLRTLCVPLIACSGWTYDTNLCRSLRILFMATKWTSIHICMPSIILDSPPHAVQCWSAKLRA